PSGGVKSATWFGDLVTGVLSAPFAFRPRSGVARVRARVLARAPCFRCCARLRQPSERPCRGRATALSRSSEVPMTYSSANIRDFIRREYRHFNAAVVKDAAEGWIKHLNEGHKMFLTLA